MRNLLRHPIERFRDRSPKTVAFYGGAGQARPRSGVDWHGNGEDRMARQAGNGRLIL